MDAVAQAHTKTNDTAARRKGLWLAASVVWLICGSLAGAASSTDVAVGSLSGGDDVTWGGYQSGSWAVVDNDSLVLPLEDYEYLPQSDTAATASVTGADATAWTQDALVWSLASATPGPGSSAAYAYAEQQIWFMATTSGALQFDVEYAIAHLLSSGPDETAFADASVGLSLYREGGMTNIMDDDILIKECTFYMSNFVEGGDSLPSDYEAGFLSVTGSFEPQEIGYLWLRADGQATGTVVPAPGALLLGALGTGLVGLLRRRAL